MKSETKTKYVIKRGKSYFNEDLNCFVENLSGAYFYNLENAAKAKLMRRQEIVVPVKITYKEEKI